MWAKIITIKRTKDLNYFSLCAFNLFSTRVSQFELNYWNKGTFPRHSNLMRCTCNIIYDISNYIYIVTNLVASHHSTTAHHPWTTTPIIHCTTTHTFPSTIAPITQLSPITNQPWLSCHTCTSFTHPHICSTLPYTRCEVLFLPRLTFLSVYHPLWVLLLCLTPDCLTLELWTCACDLDPCLVLFTSLLCLWYSCYCPLTIACLILPLSNKYCCTWIHTPLTSHYIYNIIYINHIYIFMVKIR